MIERYDAPTTLFYCDPPYIEATLSSKHRYKNSLSEAEHAALLAQLNQVQGMAVVSMVEHPLYEEGLAGWRKVSIETRTQNGNRMRECLWLSPRTTKGHRQLSLFNGAHP